MLTPPSKGIGQGSPKGGPQGVSSGNGESCPKLDTTKRMKMNKTKCLNIPVINLYFKFTITPLKNKPNK